MMMMTNDAPPALPLPISAFIVRVAAAVLGGGPFNKTQPKIVDEPRNYS
jgi:hypothetical protein